MLDELFEKVGAEIKRQDAKWGDCRDQHPALWLTILSEEIGEISKEVNDVLFDVKKLNIENYKAEIVQSIAVLAQMYKNVAIYDSIQSGEFDETVGPAEKIESPEPETKVLKETTFFFIREDLFHDRMSQAHRRSVFMNAVDNEVLKWCLENNKTLSDRVVKGSAFSREDHNHKVDVEIYYYYK